MLIGGGLLSGSVLLHGMLKTPSAEFVSSRGLHQPALTMGAADARLSTQIFTRLGLQRPDEPEIDLERPTESDLRFLMDTLGSHDAAARKSAARALTVILEPRAVGLLARAPGTIEERSFFCAGALEILRFATRDQSAALMIDVLMDTERPPTETCRLELEAKLTFIGGETSELLPGMLDSLSPRVRRYALQHLPPSSDAEMIARVRALQNGHDLEQTRLAIAWLLRSESD